MYTGPDPHKGEAPLGKLWRMAPVGLKMLTLSATPNFTTFGEICRFSTETFWRLVFSHEWFLIHLQRDDVELEMNSEPRV